LMLAKGLEERNLTHRLVNIDFGRVRLVL